MTLRSAFAGFFGVLIYGLGFRVYWFSGGSAGHVAPRLYGREPEGPSTQ